MTNSTCDSVKRWFRLAVVLGLFAGLALTGLAAKAAEPEAGVTPEPAVAPATGPSIVASALAPDQASGQADRVAGDAVAGPKRLRDYNLPGLQAKVDLKSLDPWDVVQLIEYLALRGGLNNLVIGKGVAGLTTKLKFEGVAVGDALEVVLSVNNLAYEISGGILTIMTDAEYRTSRGVSFYNNRQVRMFELKYADPTRVLQMLEKVRSDIGVIVADQVTGTLIIIDTPDKLGELKAIVEKADIATVTRTETRTFVLQHASVEEVEAEVRASLTKEVGSLRADKRTKTLIVTDLSHNLKKVDELIKAFDRRLREVFIEAKIVQVALRDEFRLGIDWNHIFDNVDPRFTLSSKVSAPTPDPFGDTPVRVGQGIGSLTYRTIVGGGDLNVVIDALKAVGDTTILSNPHVAVMDGKEATIKVVTSQPYAEAQLESGTTNVVGEKFTFIDVGVTLSATPRISEDGFVSMAIKPEVSTVTGNYQARYQVPIVRKSLAETSVTIKDGETIIIAGMIEDSKGTATTGVPLLSRIPILGLLFKSQAESTRKQETIVFLTPRIITGEEPFQLMRDMKKTPKPLRGAGGSDDKPFKSVR
jgi:type II secretory pathway component GspD/PulD (secretin)